MSQKTQKSKIYSCLKSPAGFTLLEVIAVLVILGIISAVAATRISGLWITATGEADRLAADIKYAQSLAMTRVREENNGQITVQIHTDGWEFADNGDEKLRFADGSTSRELKAGVSITPADITFIYPWGRPTDGETEITLSKEGRTITIRIHEETGYVEVLP